MAGHQEHGLAVTTLDGVQLEGIWLANGGALYVPNFCEAVGLNTGVLTFHTDNNTIYIPRSARSALYRGRELPRSKMYVDTQPDDVWGVYQFPGHQYRAIIEFHKKLHSQAWLQPVFDALAVLTFDSGAGPVTHIFNHAIVTKYFTGEDNINWHSDKPASIAPDSIILDISLGAARTFSMRSNATGQVESVHMAHGSAIIMTMAANQTHQHAVLPEPGAGPRVSIVVRNIATVMTVDEVKAKILDD